MADSIQWNLFLHIQRPCVPTAAMPFILNSIRDHLYSLGPDELCDQKISTVIAGSIASKMAHPAIWNLGWQFCGMELEGVISYHVRYCRYAQLTVHWRIIFHTSWTFGWHAGMIINCSGKHNLCRCNNFRRSHCGRAESAWLFCMVQPSNDLYLANGYVIFSPKPPAAG